MAGSNSGTESSTRSRIVNSQISSILDYLESSMLAREIKSYITGSAMRDIFHPGKLLMRSDLFPSSTDGNLDLVESLRQDIVVATRLEAVRHFIKHNRAEVDAFSSSFSANFADMTLREFVTFAAKPKAEILAPLVAPLHDLLATYIDGRRRFAAFDALPPTLRTRYLKLFHEPVLIMRRDGNHCM